MTALYNEFDPKAAAWLRWLIDEGLIPPGDVDERSIELVQPGDLDGYTHVHFFAGIGGWGYASLLAGWPADRPLWTGSCPCQPFSVAGKGLGADDPRHLWPHFFRLIRACRPPVVVGEQVAGEDGYGWFDGVAADLAGEHYASRAVDIPAAAVDSPQIRQRLYWVAVARTGSSGSGRRPVQPAGNVSDRATAGRLEGPGGAPGGHEGRLGVDLVDAAGERRGEGRAGRPQPDRPVAPTDERNGTFWSDADWIQCHDGKARRVADAGTPLLAHGIPGRVVAWRGFGNAIVPQVAAEVLTSLMETT